MKLYLAVLSLFLVSFSVGAQPPPPVAVSPSGTGGVAHLAERCPTFSWSAVPGATGYELLVLEVDEESAAAPVRDDDFHHLAPVLSVSIHGPAIAWTPALDQCLEVGRRYGWTARAIAGGQAGRWADAELFEIGIGERAELERIVEKLLERKLSNLGLIPPAPLAKAENADPPAESVRAGEKAGVPTIVGYGAVPGSADTALYSTMTPRPGIPDVGLHAVAQGATAGSTGVVGQAVAPSGVTRGIVGSVASAAGIAGLFENTTGGKMLSASDGTIEVFSVDDAGLTAASSTVVNSYVTGSLQLDGADLLLGSGTDSKPSLRWLAELDKGLNATSTTIEMVTSGTRRLSIGDDMVATTRPIQTGLLFPMVSYNRMGSETATRPEISGISDLLIGDDLQVKDAAWIGGTLTAAALAAPHNHLGTDITSSVGNADTVDGEHASAFADYDHHHLGESWTTGLSGLTVATSSTSLANALSGVASNTGTGSARGVLGKASSTQGVGVYGWSTHATLGVAVMGYGEGNASPAGFFVNAGGGPLLAANSTDSLTGWKFAVLNDGDVEIAGVLTGSGSRGSEITSSCGTFVSVAFCPAGAVDTLRCDAVAAGQYCESDGGCTNLPTNLDNCGDFDWFFRTL